MSAILQYLSKHTCRNESHMDHGLPESIPRLAAAALGAALCWWEGTEGLRPCSASGGTQRVSGPLWQMGGQVRCSHLALGFLQVAKWNQLAGGHGGWSGFRCRHRMSLGWLWQHALSAAGGCCLNDKLLIFNLCVFTQQWINTLRCWLIKLSLWGKKKSLEFKLHCYVINYLF